MKKIEVKDFGKDHWSLFAYIETRCVDYEGKLDLDHLRIKNNAIGSPSSLMRPTWKASYGTHLSGYAAKDGTGKGRQLPNHDDLDCIEDFEDAGYILNMGTGLNPACKMTKLGYEVAAKLRQHKAEGNDFATFKI